ncbi:unnamed protein product, partial [Gulo gulo]
TEARGERFLALQSPCPLQREGSQYGSPRAGAGSLRANTKPQLQSAYFTQRNTQSESQPQFSPDFCRG